MAKTRAKNPPMHYKTMVQADVPRGRQGAQADCDAYPEGPRCIGGGAALKVLLDGLKDGKPKVRSALNRATRKSGRLVVTAADGDFLYVWNAKK